MRSCKQSAAVLVTLLAGATLLSAQAAAAPAPAKAYCHPIHEFCFKYPATWSLLGSVLDGHGVVVAPPQKQEQAAWNLITVALVVPPLDEDEDPISLDEAIAQAVSAVRKSGQSFETLQRQQRTVNGKPAQMVKVHYVENGSGREWIEQLVFIAGPHSEIYSLVLKSSVASLARMDPPFQRIIASWHLQAAGGTPDQPGAPAEPKSTAPKPSVPPKS